LRLFQDPTGFDLKNINIVDKTDINTKEN